MTPKEKADELVIQMYQPLPASKEAEKGKEHLYYNQFNAAKICALIVVKHMKEIFDGLHKPEYCAFDAIGERKFTFEGEHPDHMTGYDMLEYLEQVEQEIEKL